MSEALPGYETVAERITRFYKDNPEGSIRTATVEFKTVGGKDWVLVRALAYRSPDDRLPGTGTAMDPAPGLNRFTMNAFLETAETSAWGRALASLGYHGSSIATQDEIKAVETDQKVAAVSTAAVDFMKWANSAKVPAQKIKLTLGAMGVAMGNKHLKTVVASLTDEQIQTLRGKLDES
ncbi:MAG: hypothetical protein EBT03_11445 [Betaproteobacteria bacterium]|nr:hypothetical protein [Betaproteobacteria bacterium]